MELRNFEKHINKQFESYQPTTDNDQIWANIKGHIPTEQSDRKPPFFYKFFLSILPLIAFVVFCIGSVYSSQSKNISTASLVSQINTNPIQENAIIDDKHDQEVNSQIENKNAEPTTQEVETMTTIKNQRPIDKSTTNQNINLTVNESNSTIKLYHDNETSSQITNATVFKKDINSSNSKTINKINPEALSKSEFKEFKHSSIDYFTQIQLLSPNLLTIKKREFALLPIETLTTQIQQKPKSIAKHYIGINSGYFFAQVNYQSLNNSELLALRQSSEQAFEMIQLGINYQFDLTKKWSIGTGLNLWTYNWQSLNTDVEDEVVENMFSTVNRQTITTYKRINADSGISIPLMVNFKTPISGRLNWQMGIGYEYNIKGWHSGFESDLNSQEYNINEDIKNQYKDKAGNFILAQAGVNFPLFQKTKIQFSVNTKIGSDDFQSSNAEVRKSYSFYGFNLGIQKTIN